MEIVVEAPQVDSSIPEEDGVYTGGRDNDLHASGQEVTAPLLSIHRLVTFRSRPTSLLQLPFGKAACRFSGRRSEIRRSRH